MIGDAPLHRGRLKLLALLLLAGWAGLVYRLTDIQILRSGYFSEKAERQYRREVTRAEKAMKSLADRIALYERVVTSYTRDLTEKSAQRDELIRRGGMTSDEQEGFEELKKRIDIITEARNAHRKRLTEWKTMLQGEREARVEALTRRITLIENAIRNHHAAMKTLAQRKGGAEKNGAVKRRSVTGP